MLADIAEQWGNKVGPAHSPQFLLNLSPLFRHVPEEKLTLGKFLLRCFRTENRLQGIGVVAGIPHFGADGHRRRSKVLNLLQLEIQTFCDDGQIGHVFLMATRMAADEIRNDLLAQTGMTVDVVEQTLELLELLKRRLAH